MVLVFHHSHRIRRRVVTERRFLRATVVFDVHGRLPRRGISVVDVGWRFQVGQRGRTNAEVPLDVGKLVDVVAVHSEVEHLVSVLTREPFQHDLRLHRRIHHVDGLRGVRAWPSGVHDQGHDEVACRGPRVRGFEFVAHVGGHPWYPKVPAVTGAVLGIVVQGERLANAQLGRGLVRHQRLDVGVAQGDVELKVPHGGAQEFTVAVFGHTDADGVLTRLGRHAGDHPRHGIDVHGRVGRNGVGGAVPVQVRHVVVRWGGRRVGDGAVVPVATARSAAVQGRAEGIHQFVSVRVNRAVVPSEAEVGAHRHGGQLLEDG